MDADNIYDNHSRFDKSNEIHDTAIIYDNVKMGKNNSIGAYCVIGSKGEVRGAKNFEGFVQIGDGNIISELVTIQRPVARDAKTIIGNNNIIMAHSHIGHDASIGNNCEIATGSIIGGYCDIRDGVKIKLGCTIRNRKTIGQNALIGMGSTVVKDVLENQIVFGNPAKERK